MLADSETLSNKTVIRYLIDLSSSLNKTEIKEGSLHRVFKTSFDWRMQNRKMHSADIKLSA
jgi:hypothetical protein